MRDTTKKRYDIDGSFQHFIFWSKSHTVWEYAEVDPETLCTYTDKNDENNQKIWEHDYIAFIDIYSTESGYSEYQCVGEVVWDEETASFQVTDRLSAESYEVLDECTVIGNSFDNKDLLEDY